jgi:hypothetical protein
MVYITDDTDIRITHNINPAAGIFSQYVIRNTIALYGRSLKLMGIILNNLPSPPYHPLLILGLLSLSVYRWDRSFRATVSYIFVHSEVSLPPVGLLFFSNLYTLGNLRLCEPLIFSPFVKFGAYF